MLWLAGPLVFMAGLAVVLVSLRRRKTRPASLEAPLSDAEKAALEKALGGGG